MMDREADYFPEAEQVMPHAMAFTMASPAERQAVPTP